MITESIYNILTVNWVDLLIGVEVALYKTCTNTLFKLVLNTFSPKLVDKCFTIKL